MVAADLLDAVLSRGNGAMIQRELFRRDGSLLSVVSGALERTTPS